MLALKIATKQLHRSAHMADDVVTSTLSNRCVNKADCDVDVARNVAYVVPGCPCVLGALSILERSLACVLYVGTDNSGNRVGSREQASCVF